MKIKRLLSIIIALSVMLTTVSIPFNNVSAKDYENWETVSENRAKISYYYMGKTTNIETIPTSSTPQNIPNDLDVGDIVWIGVKFSDLNKVTDLMNSSATDAASGGIYNYVLSIAYDTRYLRWNNIGGVASKQLFGDCLIEADYAPEVIQNSLYSLAEEEYNFSEGDTRETCKIDSANAKDLTITGELKAGQRVGSTRVNENTNRLFKPMSDNEGILALFGFEIYNKPAAGTKVLQAAMAGDRFTMGLNYAGDVGTMWMKQQIEAEKDVNLKNYFTLTTPDGSAVSDGVIDLFPASSSDKLASLTKTADATKALTDYIEGTKFNPAGLTIVPVKSESGDQTAIAPTATDFKDLKFYLDADGKNETTLDKTREITKDTELATTDNGKHLYVAYTLDSVTKVLDLGAITVAAQSVSSIAINTDKTTFGGTEKSYFTSDTIQNVFTKSTNPDRLVVTITYNNGKKKDVAYPNAYTEGTTTYEAFSANDLELYRYANDNYTPVTDTMKFGNGTTGGADTFYVAVKSKAGSNNDVASVDEAFKKAITATVVKDGVVISDPSPADNTKKFDGKDYKLTYGEGYPITLDNLTFMSRKESEAASTATKKSIAELDNNVVYYIADAPAPGQPAPKYNADGSTQFIPYQSPMLYRAEDHQGKTVYAVPADTKETATPIAIGVLGTRHIANATTGNTISPANTASLTYGDALTKVLHKDGTQAVETQIEVTYNNGDKETFKWDNTKKNFIKAANAAAGTPELTLLGNGTGNEGVTMRYNGAPVTDAAETVLTPTADNNGKISFTVGDSTPTTILESDSLSVAKKTAKISLTPTTSEPSKTYDGGTGLPAGKFVTETIADTLASDATLIAKVEPSGLSYTYDSKAVGTTRKIEVTGTPAVASKGTGGATEGELTEINTKYNFVLNGVTAENSKNYVTGSTGTILAKTLTVTSVPTLTGNDAVEVGQTDNLTGTYTLALNTQNSDIVAGDTVSVKFGYDYTEADKTQAGTPNVKVTFNGEGLGLSGADAANYTLNTEEFPTVKGTVANKKLASITVLPGQTGKKDYMYPDTKLDLSDWKIQLNYQGASAGEPITVSEFLQQKGVITFKDKDGTNQTINSANYNKIIADPDVTLGYGTTDLTFVWDGDDEHKGTSSVTNKKKPIRLSDIKFSPSKVYGQDDANATKAYKVPDGTFVDEDGAKVKVAYDVEFTDSDAGTSNRSATIKNITLAADGEDAANTYQNYEIVDDAGLPITNSTTTTVSDATIANGSQPAPDEPDVTVDPKTNTIIISGPLGDDIEYSIDGTNWQDEPIFTDLDLGETYPVQARVKAKDNYDPSPVSTTRETTYKYHVRAFKKNADITTTKPIAEIYTNTEKVNSDSEMNSDVFTTKPSRWKAYFTDPATTEKIEYPYTMKAETILYMTQSSSGGGGGTGGTSYYTVKFNAATNGTISEGKASVNVDSGATLTAEEIPTISPKTGYAFVGWSTDGKETVDPTTVKITKATTFTALYEESSDEPKPTATPAPTTEPKPTDAPVIDKNFMKPYASGYEDQSFRPDNNITRAELASMIARLSYKDDLPDNTFSADFPDVTADNWANKYIGYLQNLDVLSGYEDGTFRPNDLVTRGEISSVIARAQKLDIMPYDGAFEDVSDEDWAKDYIQTLVENGIASGYEDNTFGPYNPLTRAETVTMINHVLTPSTAVVTYTPSDVTGHWAASEILLAVNEREPK